MDYSGLLFFGAVLPVVLVLHFLIPDVRRRNYFLLGISVAMLAVTQILSVPLYLLLSWVTFKLARRIRKGVKTTVMLPLALNLAALVILKYLDDLLVQFGTAGPVLVNLINRGIHWINVFGPNLDNVEKIVPLGMSFYILSVSSYLLDIYRGRHPAEQRFSGYLLYIFLFPKFLQGPFVRYGEMSASLWQRRWSSGQVLSGAIRFCTGLGKKVLLGDACGRMILELAQSGSDQALIGSWLAAVLYFFRIYFDFSGWCDMAIGLGRMIGFRLPENFERPYQALSVTEFSQRWNLTLRRFFVDYVYKPFAQREAVLSGVFGAVLAGVLYGLWHGVTYNYIIFVLYFALIIFAEKQLEGILVDLPYWLRHTLTVLCLIIGWVIFSHRDLTGLADTLKVMIGEGGLKIADDGERVWKAIPLLTACWIGVSSIPAEVRKYWRTLCGIGKKQEGKPVLHTIYALSCFGFMIIVIWLSVASRLEYPAVPSIFMNL